MNTSKLADLAEITSSIAILVTLVFLVIQMQQNTVAIQANTRSAVITATLDHLHTRVTIPNINLIMVKADLSELEKSQLNDYLIAFFRLREHEWFQYRNGALDEISFTASLNSIRSVLSYDRTRTWWTNARTFDSTFMSRVDEFIADSPLLDSHLAITRFGE